MEKGAFQMLYTIKGVLFYPFFYFFNEEWGSRNRAKREFGSPPPGWRVGCVCGVGVRGCGARGCGAAGQLRLLTEMVPFPFQRHCKTAEKGSFPGVFIFPVETSVPKGIK